MHLRGLVMVAPRARQQSFVGLPDKRGMSDAQALVHRFAEISPAQKRSMLAMVRADVQGCAAEGALPFPAETHSEEAFCLQRFCYMYMMRAHSVRRKQPWVA
jgi:hypothetical protein